MTPRLQRDWATVAREYMEGRNIREICAKHDLCRRTLYRRAREGGWTRPSTRALLFPAPIEARMSQAIDQCLTLLQSEISSIRELETPGRERTLQALGALAKILSLFSQIMERRDKAARDAKASGALTPEEEEEEAEKLREELARRFQRLADQIRQEEEEKAAAGQEAADNEENEEEAMVWPFGAML